MLVFVFLIVFMFSKQTLLGKTYRFPLLWGLIPWADGIYCDDEPSWFIESTCWDIGSWVLSQLSLMQKAVLAGIRHELEEQGCCALLDMWTSGGHLGLSNRFQLDLCKEPRGCYSPEGGPACARDRPLADFKPVIPRKWWAYLFCRLVQVLLSIATWRNQPMNFFSQLQWSTKISLYQKLP